MERSGPIVFSVIVPVYNVKNYLAACVKSVVEQSGPADWECILVDDGSTDASGSMCDAFAGLCPGVRTIHRENGGLAAARNTGIRAAKGEWLLFLDSDDYWPEEMLTGLSAALAADPGFDWYVGRYLELDASAGPDAKPCPGPVDQFRPGPCEEPDYAARVARLYAAGHWAVWRYCIRRSLLTRTKTLFWDEVRWAEDYPFDLALLKACPRLCFVDLPLVVYRANRAGSLLNAGLAGHFSGIAATVHRFRALFAAPDSGWTPGEQEEVWRCTADVFWPQARAAACRDAALRRACAPGVEACRDLYDKGTQCHGRADWVLFRWLLKLFGPRFALWAAGRLKG